MTRIGFSLESVFCHSRFVAFAIIVTSLAASGTDSHAQASNSAALQAAQAINAKTAAAAFPNNPASLLNSQGAATPPLQASDPDLMRQINSLNAQAATESFANSAAADSPSSAQSPIGFNSSPSNGASGLGSPNPSYSGSSGLGSVISGGDSSGPATPDGSSVAPNPDPNTQANVPQPAQTEPSSQDATTSSTPHDSLAESADPTPAPLPTTKPRPATVTYDAGQLTVRANDSSLNLILRQIANLTGMKITGGVADERVFGNFGPSKPSAVITSLLDGTSSNMVLHQGPNATITELLLTPRGGGAVPPGPNSRIWDVDEGQSDGK